MGRAAAVSLLPSTARAVASSVSGSLVGMITRQDQCSEPFNCTPLASVGSKPARSSDDLPASDAPVTPTTPPSVICRASLTANSVVSRSGP